MLIWYKLYWTIQILITRDDLAGIDVKTRYSSVENHNFLYTII